MCHSDRYATVQAQPPNWVFKHLSDDVLPALRERGVEGGAGRADARRQPSAVVRAAGRLLRPGRGLRAHLPLMDSEGTSTTPSPHRVRRRAVRTRVCRRVGQRSAWCSPSRGWMGPRRSLSLSASPPRCPSPRPRPLPVARPHPARQDARRRRPTTAAFVVGVGPGSSGWRLRWPWASTMPNAGRASTRRSRPGRLWRPGEEPFVGRYYSTDGIDLQPGSRPAGGVYADLGGELGVPRRAPPHRSARRRLAGLGLQHDP